MGLVELLHLVQRTDPVDGRAVDLYLAERCFKIVRAGRCEAAQGNPVTGAEQDHAFNAVANALELCERAGGYGAGIDVAGMRNDQGLGR